MRLDEMLKDKETFRYMRKKEDVPGKCGVYFLFMDDELVRVGKAFQFHSRFKTYFDRGEFAYNKICWVLSARNECRELEGYMIHRFKPKYNKVMEEFNPKWASTLLPVTLWMATSNQFTVPVACPSSLLGAMSLFSDAVREDHPQYKDWLKYLVSHEQVRNPSSTEEEILAEYTEDVRARRET